MRNRIRLSVAAYAYEFLNETFMADAEFDRRCLLVDTTLSTGNDRMDAFFRAHFDPATGMWVRLHPEQKRLHALYLAHYKGQSK